MSDFRTLEEEMLILLEKTKSHDSVKILDIFQILSGKGRPLILLFLSFPFCQPIQIPGFSTPFGLMIAFIGFRLIFGKGIWLPEKFLLHTISTELLHKITLKALKLMRKIKPWIYPRLNFMCHSFLMEKFNGFLILVSGLFLALPLPIPLSNIVAAWSIFLVALGILEDDGLLVLSGYVVFFFSITVFLTLILHLKSYF